jgi:multiple sugar transport system substrate-binding protein
VVRAAAAAVLALLTACSPSEETGRLAILVPASERPFWGRVAEGFTRRTGHQIELVEGPNGTDLRESLYTTSLLAKDRSLDLVLMDVTWTPKLAGAGWLLPLDEQIDATEQAAFLPAAIDAGRFEGKLYRVPVRTDVGVLYYRRDWLEEAGLPPPQTIEELEHAARTLQAPPERWGFVWQGSQYEGLVCVFLEVLHGHGGFWVDPATLDVGLDRPEAAAALGFLVRSRSGSAFSPPGVSTYKEEESRRIFHEGRAVFLRNWPYVWRLAQAPDSPIAGKVGVTAMVHAHGGRSAGTLGGWGLGVSRFSRRPTEALAFIRYATSVEGQRALCRDSGYAPALLAAYEDPELLAANPFLSELQKVHAAAVARPAIPRYALASDLLQRRLSGALAGTQSVQDALRDAARETRALLGAEASS